MTSDDTPTNASPSVSGEAPTQVRAPRRTLSELDYRAGDTIGRYTIRQTLGEGGMGAVYLAEQREPIKRTVALKVIKPGMDSRAVVARFEAERQALAVMDHPGIAKVYDGGTTDRGLPYFVMEHVKGVPLTDHCDQHKLGLDQRLRLFMRVCDAVQHAHGKGVIHRDLKPGNILVSYQGDEHLPKVIDFGIAKALSANLSDATVFTEHGALVGTPEYMSPEQAGTTNQDVDTRADVYALGVILYEILTGARPFAETMRQAALGEIQRIIREVDPPKPSTRLDSFASSGDLATRIAEARRTDTKSLGGQLKRDLDWVVMKCLEKDRSRRYDTASALAMEIDRFLTNEPVLAGPPSVSYRLSKFVRRNRAPVVAGLAIGATLVGATALSITFALGESRARNAEALARSHAETERAVAASINEFLNVDLLQAVDPDTDGPDVTVTQILDRAADALADRFADNPEVGGRIAASLGEAYLSLGDPGSAEPLLRRAADSLGRAGGAPDDRVRAELSLAESLWRRGEIEPAVRIGERLLAETDERAPQDPLRAETLNQLAAAYKRDGRLDDARDMYLQVLDWRRTNLGDDHLETMRAEYNLALIPVLAGIDARRDADEAAATSLIETGLTALIDAQAKAERVLGPDHSHTLVCASEICSQLNRLGRLEEAEPKYRALLSAQERKLGADHWRRRQTLANYGRLLQKLERHADAASAYEQCLPGYRSARGVDAPDTVTITTWLAEARSRAGAPDDALALLERSFAELDASPGLARRVATLGAAISTEAGLAPGVWDRRVEELGGD